MAAPARPKSVSVLIVSYNTAGHLERCLSSLRENLDPERSEIVVVDNGSTDGSPEMVESCFPGVRLIRNPTNPGFAAANNVAISHASGDYVLLLNPDTEVHDDAIERCVDYAERHPAIGVLGCRVEHPGGDRDSTTFRIPRLADVAVNVLVPGRVMLRSRVLGAARYVGADFHSTLDVEVIVGCFMLVRREVVEQVGGLDEDFFMYGEEAEWCFRIRNAGWGVRYWPGALITHYGGVSAAQVPERSTLAMADAQLRLINKTRGRTQAFLSNWLMLLRDAPRWALWHVLGLLPRLRHGHARRTLQPSAVRIGLHLGRAFSTRWLAAE